MAIYRIGDDAPVIPASAYVAAEATLIGRVILGENASVWPGAVLRGDNEPIRIGAGSNVQEGAVLHTDPGCPLDVAEDVTIGHQAMLHGCTVGAGSLIGIQAIVLNRSVIGRMCLVGAGAVVTEGKTFPDRSMILGAPAKVARELDEANAERLRMSAQSYAMRGRMFREKLVRIG
ncbi:MAG: gamma carbonic anhydrase family protein [Rhodospirillales bacterium]|nr:gamma carbonic anhydrase family protein [Rhodospirillales bacterium]